jgi:hypothetical protein
VFAGPERVLWRYIFSVMMLAAVLIFRANWALC